jgi:dihydropteroate synthase
MGILNVTPDSFFDGGRYTHEESILIRVEQMLKEGASLVDIGAASSRPGSKPVPEKEELARLIPAIKAIRLHFSTCLISVDTYRASIAREAIEAGADIINDIAGGSGDAGMFAMAARLKTPYILMHMAGSPVAMHEVIAYADILQELMTYFTEKTTQLIEAGVEQIILDPGFGFGKTLENNFELLAGMDRICLLGYPVLAGLSRKSMINKTLQIKPDEALNGTTAANTIALMRGASILRVHDVKEAQEAIKIVMEIKRVQAEDQRTQKYD